MNDDDDIVEDTVHLNKLVGRTIDLALTGLDRWGCTTLILLFTDGSKLTTKEQGQVGYFTCKFEEKQK